MAQHSENKSARLVVVAAVLIAALLACNFPTGEVPTPVTPTVETTPLLTATPLSSATPTPTATLSPGITPSPTVCTYNARFLDDITVPDGTEFESGAAFDKTWRMDNTGCLNWPAGTQLVYVRGDKLGTNVSVDVPATVIGGVVDITVKLTAPAEPGEYTGYWQLRAPGGVLFGPEVFVNIKVKEPQGKPDLAVREVLYQPDPLITGIPLTFTVRVENKGTREAPASKLQVQIQGSGTYTLDVPVLAAGATHNASANIQYATPGTYAYSITLDTTAAVAESDETNNSVLGNIKVRVLNSTSGSTTVAINSCFDLDAGTDSGCDATTDFLWEEVSGNRFLTPDDATFSVVGATAPTYHSCRAASKSANQIAGTQIPTGTYLCVQTSGGAIASIKITSYGATLGISYTIWSVTDN